MFTVMLAAAMITQGSPIDPQSAYFASILNYQRQLRGLGPVGVDQNAVNAAYQNNVYQTQRGLGHFYQGGFAQCVAVGQPDPASALNAWMNSPAHAAILFNPSLSRIGFNMMSGCYTFSGL
jgi:uncharacterized protein YkwD